MSTYAGAKRAALALLLLAALLYALAVAMQPGHVAWGYLAAFSEAAMVGAIADWFAVVALFRHPLGLPIPHTAVIPRHKEQIGHNLGRFMAAHFLSAEQVGGQLQLQRMAQRLAAWLQDPDHARQCAGWLGATAPVLLEALHDPRAHAWVVERVQAGMARLEVASMLGQAMELGMREQRHQELLDVLLVQLARALADETVQESMSAAIAREVSALRRVGLDRVAAQLATRKIIVAMARTMLDMAEDPQHPLRLRFDAWVAQQATRLQHEAALQSRVARWRDELLAEPALAAWVRQYWAQWLAWVQSDLDAGDSRLLERLATALQDLGRRLGQDESMRQWLDGMVLATVPGWVARHGAGVADFIAARVAAWDTEQLTDELEQRVGRDLQFIRINGTLVGGLVGLTIHAVTRWLA